LHNRIDGGAVAAGLIGNAQMRLRVDRIPGGSEIGQHFARVTPV